MCSMSPSKTHRTAMADAPYCDDWCSTLRWLMHRTAFPVLSRRSMPAILLYGTIWPASRFREAHRGKGGIGFCGIMKCIREKPNAGSMPPRTLFERKTGLDLHHCALRLERRGSEFRCPANPVCMNTRSLPRDIVWQASLISLLECGLSCRQALRGRALHKLYVREHM